VLGRLTLNPLGVSSQPGGARVGLNPRVKGLIRAPQRSHWRRRSVPYKGKHVAKACQTINQSKILTEPHTGKEKPIPALPHRAAKPATLAHAQTRLYL